MNENTFEVPPISENELAFLDDHGVNPVLRALYERVRETILLFGNIEVRATREYITFRHPYHQYTGYSRQPIVKYGTLFRVTFRDNSIFLNINTLGKTIRDPKNILKKVNDKTYMYTTTIKPLASMDGLMTIIPQVIYCISHKIRVVRIHGIFVTIKEG